MRILLDSQPFPIHKKSLPGENRGVWPCSWVGCPTEGLPPIVSGYRLPFEVKSAETVRVHVAADERYELFLDGVRIGRGSERGDVNNWFFETYDLDLAPGSHWLAARVSALADRAPLAQFSVRPGFLLCPQDPAWQEKIGTGKARWVAKALGGYQLDSRLVAWGTGDKLSIFADKFDWGFQTGEGEGWQTAAKYGEAVMPEANDQAPTQFLSPATLRPQLEQPWEKGVIRHVANALDNKTAPIPIHKVDDLPNEHGAWFGLIREDKAITIPPHSRKRVLVDLEDYLCAYPEVVTTGGRGSFVRIHWEEALYTSSNPTEKGNRDEIEGKYFTTSWSLQDGVGDCFYPDGAQGRKFETLWWECGRYVEILLETHDDPLIINSLRFIESRYPMEMESHFETNDPRFREATPIMLRALQMCSHETYMDCPFYEQLQYVGDTRLQVLTTYTITQDDRLPKKALRLFDASRLHTGLTQSRYPSRIRQIIPPFSLWYVAMVHDFAMWRDDLTLVKRLMPGVRGVLEAYRSYQNADGLIEAVEGWNYADWVPKWDSGVPPDGQGGVSAVLNYQTAFAFQCAADLERFIGEPDLAHRHQRVCDTISQAADKHFWDEKRGLLADDLSHQHWSEHTQALALLVGHLPSHHRDKIATNLVTDPNIERTTIYFSHYLFEALRLLNRTDKIMERLQLWFDLKAKGFKTTLESPEPTRSDCHAWGAHPIYHTFASILGIRPTSPGFKTVEIRPQFGPLEWARGEMPHPKGKIVVELHQESAGLVGSITLPDGVTGELVHGGKRIRLRGGSQTVQQASQMD